MSCSLAQFKLKNGVNFSFSEGKLFFLFLNFMVISSLPLLEPDKFQTHQEASACTRKVLVNYDWPYKVIARCFGLLSKFSKVIV